MEIIACKANKNSQIPSFNNHHTKECSMYNNDQLYKNI